MTSGLSEIGLAFALGLAFGAAVWALLPAPSRERRKTGRGERSGVEPTRPW